MFMSRMNAGAEELSARLAYNDFLAQSQSPFCDAGWKVRRRQTYAKRLRSFRLALSSERSRPRLSAECCRFYLDPVWRSAGACLWRCSVGLPSWRTVPELQQRLLSCNVAITFYDPKEYWVFVESSG